jgi:hypothetical protein
MEANASPGRCDVIHCARDSAERTSKRDFHQRGSTFDARGRVAVFHVHRANAVLALQERTDRRRSRGIRSLP